MTIRIGTSGWSYDDWQGTVYPKSLAAAERLRWFADQLPTVEIDSTFYRNPPPAFVRGWIAKVRASPKFEFSVKAPERLTHELLAKRPPSECALAADAWATLVARPLHEAGRLGAVLLQLSPGVLHTRDHVARLDAALAALEPLDVAVEFRNRTWHTEGDSPALKHDALALLRDHGAASVIVDGPSFPAIVAEDGARHAYVRFHGRNRADWFKRGASASDRYDYLYSEDELSPWAERLAQLADARDLVRVYFNNHVDGKAFQDARLLGGLLDARGAPRERAGAGQTRIPV